MDIIVRVVNTIKPLRAHISRPRLLYYIDTHLLPIRQKNCLVAVLLFFSLVFFNFISARQITRVRRVEILQNSKQSHIHKTICSGTESVAIATVPYRRTHTHTYVYAFGK